MGVGNPGVMGYQQSENALGLENELAGRRILNHRESTTLPLS
jgi:hypothetical protein